MLLDDDRKLEDESNDESFELVYIKKIANGAAIPTGPKDAHDEVKLFL